MTNLKNRFFWVITLPLLFLFASCGSDDDTGGGSLFSIADLQGDWEATRAVFTSVSTNPQLQKMVIVDGGTGSLTVAGNGNFTLVITPMGENPQITSGQFLIANNILEATLDTDPNNPVIWGVQVNGSNMMLQPVLSFDFDGNGTFDAATGDMDLVLQ